MPSIADLLKKQIAQKTAQAKRKADTPVTTPDQMLTALIETYENKEAGKVAPTNLDQNRSKLTGETQIKPRSEESTNLDQNLDQNRSKFKQETQIKLRSEVPTDSSETVNTFQSKKTYGQDRQNKLRSNLDHKKDTATSDVYNADQSFDKTKSVNTDSKDLKEFTINTASEVNESNLNLDQSRSRFSETEDNKLRSKPRSTTSPNLDQNRSKFKQETQIKLRSETFKESELRSNLDHNLDQSEQKPRSNLDLKSLPSSLLWRISDLQQSILFYIYLRCKLNAEKTTGPVRISDISTYSETTDLTAQLMVKRLINNNLLQREQVKAGRGGWTNYRIPIDTFSELQRLDYSGLIQNLDHNKLKPRSELRSEPRSNSSSSISSNINTTTKENREEQQVVPDDWKVFNSETFTGIDIEPLASIGFTETHLKQLYRANTTTVEDVQASIYMFAFDLEHNKKADSLKGPALNFFMGIMRRLGAYTKPENYKSPREIAQEKLRNEKRAEADRIRLMEVQNFEDEFTIWWAGLSKEAQESISSSEHTKQRRMYDAKKYYRAEVLKESNESH